MVLLLTIIKPTRTTHTSATIIDNIYVATKCKPDIHSAIHTVDISGHLPAIIWEGSETRSNKNKPIIIKSNNIYESNKNFNKYFKTYQLVRSRAYVAFSNKLSEIINNEVKEKIIMISASQIIRDPWMTNGLITSSCNLNKLYRNKWQRKVAPRSIKFYKYRNNYNNLKRNAKIKFCNETIDMTLAKHVV